MNKKQLIAGLIAWALIIFASDVYSQEIYKKDGEEEKIFKGCSLNNPASFL